MSYILKMSFLIIGLHVEVMNGVMVFQMGLIQCVCVCVCESAAFMFVAMEREPTDCRLPLNSLIWVYVCVLWATVPGSEELNTSFHLDFHALLLNLSTCHTESLFFFCVSGCHFTFHHHLISCFGA